MDFTEKGLALPLDETTVISHYVSSKRNNRGNKILPGGPVTMTCLHTDAFAIAYSDEKPLGTFYRRCYCFCLPADTGT